MTTAAAETLDKLIGFLGQDPQNRRLLADAAAAALDARRPDLVEGFLEQYEALDSLSSPLLNIRALAAMAQGRHEDAANAFSTLLAHAPDQPTLRFNLAWAKAMLGDWQAVADLVDADVATVVPRACGLKVQALHHLGLLDEALAWGEDCIAHQRGDTELFAALSVAAVDDERMDLAEQYALRAGDTHEGRSTLGMIALAEQRVEDSVAHFDAALIDRPDSARALLGKGLAQLLTGQAGEAAMAMDRSAEVFGDHLGAWISAGWAHFRNGDTATARARFEHALELDQTFAETHGALAVMDILDGDREGGRRRAAIAHRLDRKCLSATLAQSLLLVADGRQDTAGRLIRNALSEPIGPDGETIAAMMVRYGSNTPGFPRGRN
jgi:tetratricopeptide (TPR) repeat protein